MQTRTFQRSRSNIKPGVRPLSPVLARRCASALTLVLLTISPAPVGRAGSGAPPLPMAMLSQRLLVFDDDRPLATVRLRQAVTSRRRLRQQPGRSRGCFPHPPPVSNPVVSRIVIEGHANAS